MRKNQVSIQIERFGDQVPEGYPEATQEIMVYADSNDLWEALAAAYCAVMDEIQKYENVRSFKWAEVTTNASERGKLMWKKAHGMKIDVKKDNNE